MDRIITPVLMTYNGEELWGTRFCFDTYQLIACHTFQNELVVWERKRENKEDEWEEYEGPFVICLPKDVYQFINKKRGIDMVKIVSPENIRIYQTDNRLLFENGRLYTTRTPFKDGKQVGFAEKIDVTDDVMEALKKAYYNKLDAAKQASILEQLKI